MLSGPLQRVGIELSQPFRRRLEVVRELRGKVWRKLYNATPRGVESHTNEVKSAQNKSAGKIDK